MQEVIKRGQYQPRAAQVDYQVGRPAAPAMQQLPTAPSGLEQVATALSGVNSSIGSFLKSHQENRRREATAYYAAEVAKVTDDDLESYAQQVRSGIPQDERDALDGQLALRLANARRRQAEKMLATGELNSREQDVEAIVQGWMAQDLDSYDSIAFRETYSRAAAPAMEALRTKLASDEAVFHLEEREQNLYGIYSQAIEEWEEKAPDNPAALASILQAIKEEHGKDSNLHVPFERQDELWLTIATQAALDGREATANAILDAPRPGIPSLAKTKKHLKKVAEIKAMAERNGQAVRQEEAWNWSIDLLGQANRGELNWEGREQELRTKLEGLGWTPVQVASLVERNRDAQRRMANEGLSDLRKVELDRQEDQVVMGLAGSFLSGQLPMVLSDDIELSSSDGEMSRTLRANDLEQKAIDLAIDQTVMAEMQPQIDQARAQGDEATAQSLEDEAMRRAFSLMKDNGVYDYKNFSRVMKAGHMSAGPNGKITPTIAQGYRLYRQARAVDHTFAQKMAGTSADFYENVDMIVRELHGGNLETAIQTAAAMEDSPEFQKYFTEPEYREVLDDAVKNVRSDLDGNGWWNPFSTVDEGGNALIKSKVIKYARMSAAKGVTDMETAIELGYKQFAQNHQVVNGVIVPNAKVNMAAPSELPKVSEYAAKLFTEQHPDMVRDERGASEFALIPWPKAPNQFSFHDKTSARVQGNSNIKLRVQTGPETFEEVPTLGIQKRHMDILKRGLEYERRAALEYTRKTNSGDGSEEGSVGRLKSMMDVGGIAAVRRSLAHKSDAQLLALKSYLEEQAEQRGRAGDKLYMSVMEQVTTRDLTTNQ